VFGCLCYPLLRPYGHHKLEYRSKPWIFLGYQYVGYKCLDPVTNKAYLSRHVIFYEDNFPAQDHATSLLPSQLAAPGNSTISYFPLSSSLVSPAAPVSFSAPTAPSISQPQVVPPTSQAASQPIAAPSLSSAVLPHPDTCTPTTVHPLEPALPDSPAVEPYNLPQPVAPCAPPSVVPPPVPPPTSPPAPQPSAPPPPPLPTITTHSHTGSLKPKQFLDFKLFHTKYPLLAFQSALPDLEPTCYSKAATDPKWQAAMRAEFEALVSNHTWTFCSHPPHRHVIHNKWIYKVKRHADGSVDRFKARLVAKGFEQQSGLDYTETFSPVIKPATIRLILALVVHFEWPIRQLDVSNAFLHGSLTEEVYMEQPHGFVDPQLPDFVCKLHKTIYGLKQGPRAWYTRLSTFLLELGFTVSRVDTSLFIFLLGPMQQYLLLYVDDIIVTGTHPHLMDALINRLQQEFPVKDLGPLHYFLGIQVHRTDAGLHLCQSKYVADLLHRTNMAAAKPVSSPCATGSKLSRYDGEVLHDASEYRSVVGAFQYCTLTRPDIAYSVKQLCQHLHHPTSTHWLAVNCVLRFLKQSMTHGLAYTKTSLQLNALCDSDWAGSVDDRRSTSSFVVYLGDCLISWSAKKQLVVSCSSTEVEYHSLAIVTVELFWLCMLLRKLRVPLPLPPVVWCDNVSALALASNPVYHARTKYIEVDYHFVREKVLNKDISISFISTADQIADIFTKGLSTAQFLFLQSKLTVTPSPVSLRGDVKPHATPRDTAVTTAVSIADNPVDHTRSNQDSSFIAAYHARHSVKHNHAANHSCISSIKGNLPKLKTASFPLSCSSRSLHLRHGPYILELQHLRKV